MHDDLPMAEIPADLAEIINPHLRTEQGPGDGTFQGISLEGVARAATHWAIPPRRAMIRLLHLGVWPLRFARNRGVMSADDQARLLASRAAILGCGGLGGYAATLLARMGVGSLALCDYDAFDETNLNRQLAARENTLGRNKAAVLSEDVLALASHVETRVFPTMADAETLPWILGECDLAVDCLDSLAARLSAESACRALGIPFVHGSIAGDEGFFMTVRPGDGGLAALYDGVAAEKGAESRVGVPAQTPAVVAAMETFLAREALLEKDGGDGGLHHIDLSGMTIETMRVE